RVSPPLRRTACARHRPLARFAEPDSGRLTLGYSKIGRVERFSVLLASAKNPRLSKYPSQQTLEFELRSFMSSPAATTATSASASDKQPRIGHLKLAPWLACAVVIGAVIYTVSSWDAW